MKINECEAQFQNEYYEVLKSLFISPRIRSQEDTFDLDFSFSYEIVPIGKQEEVIKGAVKLDVKCFPKKHGENASIVDTTLLAVFNGKGFDDEQFEEMLKLNGLTFLIQIARTHIITITSMTGNPPIIMPMINVSELIAK